MLNKLLRIVVLSLLVNPSWAANYFVAPAGNDTNDGTSVENAWYSLDNGDQLSVLIPGDTVFILPGDYILSSTLQLKTDGTADQPIVYNKSGEGDVTLDGDGESNIILLIEGNYIEISGLNLTNTRENAIHIKSDFCVISDFYIYDIEKIGLRVEGSYCLFLKNIIANAVDEGIKNEGPGEYNLYYGNTVYSCGKEGIELKNKLSRLFNNIFVGNEQGIRGDAENICAFNNVWNNTSADYNDGVVDSAGGISADPLFTNVSGGDYSLESGSPCINAGLDLGYTYFGIAPEMGAVEYPELAQLTITPSYDSLFADVEYQFDVTALDNLGGPIDPGTLDWSHTFATGSIDADGLFTPQLVGSGQIIVESDINGITDTSVVINVVPGTLDSIYITPNRDTISTDTTQLFAANGFDVNGNSTSNMGVITWLVLNGIGRIDDTGLFNPIKTSYGFIKAASNLGVFAYTDSIFVIPGSVAYINVSPQADVIEQTASTQYEAIGYDADSNLVSDLTGFSTWSTTDPDGSVTVGGLYTAGNILGIYYVNS